MLRPRNGTSPDGEYPPEPDTPGSHYSPTMGSAGADTTRRSLDGRPAGGAAMIDEKSGATTSSASHGLGIANRRGSAVPSISLGLGSGSRGSKVKGLRMGLSQRTWTVIGVVVSLLFLSRFLLPSSDDDHSGHHHHTVDSHELIPRDYLNNSQIDPAPFDFCPVFGPGDAIAERRGQLELLRSRLHSGTGARVQKVLQKAMSGAPITMSVLGGSISACTGAGDDPVGEKCYPSKLFNWWNTIFPHPANELTNGAVRKTDSAYYAYCAAHHLPDATDLVILEFDAADPNDPEWLSHFELLVRSILVRPEMPAVIVLGHFSPQVQANHGFAGPELLHNVVAQFYDVPHISVKGVIYEQYLRDSEQTRSAFYHDANHANGDGHDLIADVLISYLMSQICSGWLTLQGHSFDAMALGTDAEGLSSTPSLLGGVGLRKGMPGQNPGDGDSNGNALTDRFHGLRVPQMRLADRPSNVKDFREIEPFCVAANDLINPLPPSLFYGSGWKLYNPPKGAVKEDRHYWYAEQPTARLRIPLKLGAGDVGIYFLQSPVDKPLGHVKCWVDDNKPGAKDLYGTAEVDDVIATLEMIDRGVARGSHFVECELQGEPGGSSAPFKILGVFNT